MYAGILCSHYINVTNTLTTKDLIVEWACYFEAEIVNLAYMPQ